MKKCIFILMMIAVLTILSAETSGEYGFQILKINTGAQSNALAGSGSLYNTDAFVFLQNPAAGSLIRRRVVTFAQNYWLLDTLLNSGGYYYNTGRNSFGAAYRYLDYGKIVSRDEAGNITGEFHPMDLILTVNFGRRLNPDHFVAINMNILYEKIESASSYGFSTDLGYLYRTPIKDLNITAAVKNLGITSKMDQERIDLPISLHVGAAKAFDLLAIKLETEFIIIKNIDDDKTKMNLGINLPLMNAMNIRLGYKFNYDAEDLSFGFGLNWRRIIFDYAYLPFNADLNNAHIIAMTFKL